MTQALAIREYSGLAMVMTPDEAQAQLQQLQQFIKKNMERGKKPGEGDYGPFPGTEREVLYQPGAQKLAEIYGLAHKFDFETKTEDWEKPCSRGPSARSRGSVQGCESAAQEQSRTSGHCRG